MDLDILPSMVAMVQSSDQSSWLKATTWFQELLSHARTASYFYRDDSSADQSPLIKEVVRSRVVHKFVLFLAMDGFPDLQEAAAQVLIRIALGTSTDTKFCEGMDTTHRALVLLLHSDDKEVLCHACASLGVVSGCKNVNLKEMIIKTGLYSRVRQLVNHESPIVVIGALRTLGNLTKGDENVIQLMLSDGGFIEVQRLLNHENVSIQKEACWASSSLCAGAGWVIENVFAAGLMEPLVNILKTADIGIREVAALAISNATSGATNEHIKYLVSLDCIRALCLQLCCKNKRILDASLNALENIMKSGETLKKDEDDVNPYAAAMYDVGGWGLLSDFYAHYDYEVYRKALLLQKRYSVHPEYEDEE